MLGLGIKKKVKKLTTKKAITSFRPQIRSQHPTHRHLRNSLDRVGRRVVIRLGSVTTLQKIYGSKLTAEQIAKVVEVNTVNAIKNSANKRLMKQCFTQAGVKTADWTNSHSMEAISELEFPVISKHIFGSRGTGNQLHGSATELEQWMRGKDLSHYIFEKFHNFSREYRLHVTADGCFYTCRKMLKSDADRETSWQRHDDNCVWILEGNPSFDKPSNWNEIVEECVKALNAVGLDVGGFDVKVQSRTDNRERVRQNPDFIVIESNSACSHGDVTAVKYREQLNNIIRKKVNGGSGR